MPVSPRHETLSFHPTADASGWYLLPFHRKAGTSRWLRPRPQSISGREIACNDLLWQCLSDHTDILIPLHELLSPRGILGLRVLPPSLNRGSCSV